MTFQTEILADVTRRERALDASPARLERHRTARLLEAIARCCRPTLAMRHRAAAWRLAAWRLAAWRLAAWRLAAWRLAA